MVYPLLGGLLLYSNLSHKFIGGSIILHINNIMQFDLHHNFYVHAVMSY